MKKKVVYALVVDKSGSMADIQSEILMSLNDRIKAIQKINETTDKEVLVELVAFNESVRRILPLVKAKKLAQLKAPEYEVGGTTALYDALGSTLERMYLTFGSDIEKGNCSVVIVVYTDGYENASRMYSKQVIREMLGKANSMKNVEITMVGCDEETLLMAQEMNFKQNNVVRTSKDYLSASMNMMDGYLAAFSNDEMPNFKSSYKDFDLDQE